MEGNYLSPIIDAFKPMLIFAAVLWGIEIIITMLIKDHKKAKRKQAREKRRLEYQDHRLANDAEHAKVTRAMRYNVLRRDNFHCVRCGRGKEDGVKLHVDHLADWSMARSVIFLVAKLLSFLAAGSDAPMEDTGFARCYVECLDKTLWCIPFAFNPFFSSGKRGCRLLADKLTDYRSYQQLVGILTHREKIGDFGTEDIYAEVFGSASFDESGAAFILTAPISSEKYISLFDGWNDKAERNYLLCTQVGCSQRSDAENIINALIGSVSNLAVSDGQTDLGWKTDTSAWFSSRPVPRLKRNSLFAELLYRIVYRDSLNIGICRNCGAPFLQSGIGSLNDVCSQACRMAQRRRKGLA